MIAPRRSNRLALRLVFATALIFSAAACEIYDGDLPPTDELQSPIGLAVHPSGDYLYVLNTNFQSLYRADLGGTLSVVDLDTLRILDDKTLCLPSFGAQLGFGSSNYSETQPRHLFAVTKSNRGGVAIRLNESGDTPSCLFEGEAVGNTCVADIATIPGVSKRHRMLPCEIPNLLDDPSAVNAIAAHEGVTPLDQDAFIVVGQRRGDVRAVNLINGEIRGEDAQGRQRGDLHFSPKDVVVSAGADAVATHPITGEAYIGARFDNRIFTVRWLREAVGDPALNPQQGFANRIARIGGLRVASPYTNLEIRDMKFSADGTRLFATSQSPSSLLEIDTSLDDDGDARDVQVRRTPLSARPGSLDIVDVGGRLYAYVALFSDRQVAVIDLDAGTLVDTIDVGATPYTVVTDPTRLRVYVALFEENAVAVIDADPSRPTWNRQIATIR